MENQISEITVLDTEEGLGLYEDGFIMARCNKDIPSLCQMLGVDYKISESGRLVDNILPPGEGLRRLLKKDDI